MAFAASGCPRLIRVGSRPVSGVVGAEGEGAAGETVWLNAREGGVAERGTGAGAAGTGVATATAGAKITCRRL
jgi:hypothetical protein